MAYYYFDSDDHINTIHNADVYLLANVGNYHDNNIHTDSKNFNGFYMNPDTTFTIGGTYGEDWNIHHKTILNKNTGNTQMGAIIFNGNGEVIFSSQIGAADGAKHDDRDIRIHAYNFLTNDIDKSISTTYDQKWFHIPGKKKEENYKEDYFGIEQTNPNTGRTEYIRNGSMLVDNIYYKLSGQVADVNGIYAKNKLTFSSDFNGYVTVTGFHESIGMLTNDKKDVQNTAIDTVTIASGFRADNNIEFKGNFFGNTKTTVRVRLQTVKTLSGPITELSGNTAAAYGVYAANNITNNNIWSGSIFTAANMNYMDASISTDRDGQSVSIRGHFVDNKTESIGIKSDVITINQLDWTKKLVHAASTAITSTELNAVFKWEDIVVSIADNEYSTQVINFSNSELQVLPAEVDYYWISLPDNSIWNDKEGELAYFTNGGKITGHGEIFDCDGGTNLIGDMKIKVSKEVYDAWNAAQAEDMMGTWIFGTKEGEYNIIYDGWELHEDESDFEYKERCTVTWKSEKLDTGYFIFIFKAPNSDSEKEILTIRAEDVASAYDPATGTYTYQFTESDDYIYTLDLFRLADKELQNFFIYEPGAALPVNASGNALSAQFSFISEEADINNIDFDASFVITGSNGKEKPNTVNKSVMTYNKRGIGNGLYMYTFTSGINNSEFIYEIPQDDEILIYAQASNNIYKAMGDVKDTVVIFTDNNIQGIGIEGKDSVTIKNFTEGSVIKTDVTGNSMSVGIVDGSCSIVGNDINAYGIFTNTLNLHDFDGTISVIAEDNFIDADNFSGSYDEMTVSGIQATVISGSKNLNGKIDVYASENYVSDDASGGTSRNDQYGSTVDFVNAYHKVSGISTVNMTVDGFINTDIYVKDDTTKKTITSYTHNAFIVSGIRVEGTLKAKGFTGDIKVETCNNEETIGMYVKQFDSELGYYYTFRGEDAGSDIGSNIGEKKYVVALDSFNIEGSIIVQSVADKPLNITDRIAVATRNTANLYVNGYIYAGWINLDSNEDYEHGNVQDLYELSKEKRTVSYEVKDEEGNIKTTTKDGRPTFKSYAIKTDFANTVSSGFNNDIIQFGDEAVVFGIMHLGGGSNNITFDDDSRYFGFIFHDNGKTNITYSLNGAQADDGLAIHTANEACDATLTSGTLITIDCNNIKLNETYKLIEYVADAIQTANAHWINGSITVSYMGESALVYLADGKGTVKLAGSNDQDIYISVKYEDNVLSVTGYGENDQAVQKDKTIVTVDINDVLTEGNGYTVKNDEIKDLTAYQTAFNGYIKDTAPAVYNRDEKAYTSTTDSTIYWMCKNDPQNPATSDYRHSSYEVVYDIYEVDENGKKTDRVSTALLRLNTVDGEKNTFSGKISIDGYTQPASGKIILVDAEGKTSSEVGAGFVGAYYIISYDIKNIPNNCIVEYRVRDYYGDGFEISPWAEGSITTQKQVFDAYVENVTENMKALNPDDDTRSISSAIALFTWEQPESKYKIVSYNVQYFSSTEDLSGKDNAEKRSSVFAAYEYAINKNLNKTQDKWHKVEDSNFEICFFSNGEIRLRERQERPSYLPADADDVYNYYSFVSKNTSATELLVSGLANQSYVYWRVNATDVTGKSSAEYVEGGDFRIFLGDTEGPAFIASATLTCNQAMRYDLTKKKFEVQNFSWGGVQAEDEKSGVRYYIIEAKRSDEQVYREIAGIDASEFNDPEELQDVFSFYLDPGVYEIRVRPVDAAGNYGTPSNTMTIYAVDNTAPKCEITTIDPQKWLVDDEANTCIGWNYTYSFNKAEDIAANDKSQSTGVKEYTVEVYFTDANGIKNNVDWKLYGLVADETGNQEYVLIEGVTPQKNTFVPDPKYLSYQVRTPNMTYLELDDRNYPLRDQETGELIYNGRDYHITISVSDNIGNVNTIIDSRIDVSPEGGDTPTPPTPGETNPPSGKFTSIADVKINATHRIVSTGGTVVNPDEDDDELVSPAAETDDDSSTTPTITYGPAEKVTATFSWTDTYTSPDDVYYLMQISDSAFFDSDQTYTVLVLPSSLSSSAQWDIYNSLVDKYENLRMYIVSGTSSSTNTDNDQTGTTTSSGGETWRTSTSNGYKTTLVMDNLLPTASIGMLANKGKTYWQVKAVDKNGTEADFEAVQDFNFVSNVTNQKITENGKATAPYDVEITAHQDFFGYSVNGDKLLVNTGNQELSFTVNNTSTLLGYDHFIAEFTSKNGGNTGEYEIYALSADNGGGPITDCYNCFLKNRLGETLRTGDYSITVKAYDYNGKYAASEKYTFIQDYTRPVITQSTSGSGNNKINSTIKVAFDKPAEDDTRVLTTVSWPLAVDEYGIKGYVFSYRCPQISNEWQTAFVNDSKVLTSNSCQITLFNGYSYDFAVYAIDNNGNCSEETIVNNVVVSYKDIDDGIADDNPFYTPFSTGPITIYNQLIGGSDAEDNIYVSSDNGYSAPGEIQLTIFNLQKISGSGNSIIVDIYEDNGGEIKVGSYTFKLNNQTQSSEGFTIKHMVENSGNDFRLEVRSGNSKTIMQYDLHYAFDWFDATADNNTAFMAARNETIIFDEAKTTTGKDYWMQHSVNVGGTPQDTTDYVNRVGFGDQSNYTLLHVDTAGRYTFTATKGSTDSLSALKITVYQMKPGATTLSTVKSFTVSAKKAEGVLKDLQLTEGDYVIQVNSTSAAKGANVRYNLEISATQDKYYSYANNTDDFFAYGNNVVLTGDTQYLFGNEEEFDYVGISDAVDFKKITVDKAGEYTFNIGKLFTYDDDIKLDAYGLDGSITMTIYELEDGKTALKKIKSVTVKAKKWESELTTLLDKGEYFIEVKASSPTKTAVSYKVNVESELYGAEGNATIIDEKEFSATFNDQTGLRYLNDSENAEEGKDIYEYIGYGEANNYFEVNFDHDGSYTFTVNRSLDTKGSDFSAIKATLYTTNATGDGMTAVKTVTLKNSQYSSTFTLSELAAGQYFIGLTATDAAKGKFANYNISVTTNAVYKNNVEEDEEEETVIHNFVNAETVEVNTDIDDVLYTTADQTFYRFETGDYAGSFEFDGVTNVYELNGNNVNLTKINLNGSTAYLNANSTYFVGVNIDDEFAINHNLVQNITEYSADSDFTELTETETVKLDENTQFNSFSSWVGYGDLESWRKLELEQGGNFNFSLTKDEEEIATAVTVTVYEIADNGNSLKAIGNFSVSANASDGMKNFLLEAGNYYLQVKATTEQGYTDFTVNVNGSSDENFENYVEGCFTAKVDIEKNDTALTEAAISISSDVNDWVGYTDEYDYFNVEVSEDGYYDFNFINTDAAQVTLYVVNPNTSKLTAVATYTAKAENEAEYIFADKNGNSLLLNSDSEYIAMVKSTNAKKGGNCDYTLSIIQSGEGISVSKFVIEDGCNGKYTFENEDGYDISVKKFNETTGKFSDIKLNSSDIATLSAGTYFLTSTDGVTIDQTDVDPVNKLITIA